MTFSGPNIQRKMQFYYLFPKEKGNSPTTLDSSLIEYHLYVEINYLHPYNGHRTSKRILQKQKESLGYYLKIIKNILKIVISQLYQFLEILQLRRGKNK